MQKKTIGIVLIVLGVIMIAYTGFNFTTAESVVDIGPVHINQDKNHFVQWSPVIGVLLLVGGIVAIALNKKISV
jgi:drug/metabolite transporter (DMT)-like permease